MSVVNSTFNKHRNRHHLLYPARAWRSIGPNALILRGAFIVKIDEKLHEQLHRELDGLLGERITRRMMPQKSTIKQLKKLYRRQESAIRKMNAIEKIEWLEEQLDSRQRRNRWLLQMLGRQKRFFIRHQEEM